MSIVCAGTIFIARTELLSSVVNATHVLSEENLFTHVANDEITIPDSKS